VPRPRKYRRDLPECVYFKNGAYYYVTNNKWKRLGSDYQEAMAQWAQTISEPRQAVLVGELLDRYLREVVPSKAERTQKDNRQEVRQLRTFFGDMAIADVAPPHIVAYVATREAKTRANREIALLSHAFNKARLWGLVTNNPCSVPGTRNRETARDRYVTDIEIEQFKKECPQWLKDYLDLKLLLGLRQQDMLALRWDWITDTSLLVTPQKTRRSASRRLAISISPELRSILDRLPKSYPTLFATRSGTQYSSSGFNSTWTRAMGRYTSTGNERFHEHDIRGKVATDMDDPIAAKALLGHSKMSMTEQYIKARKTDVVQPHSRKK
jgi:integrase